MALGGKEYVAEIHGGAVYIPTSTKVIRRGKEYRIYVGPYGKHYIKQGKMKTFKEITI